MKSYYFTLALILALFLIAPAVLAHPITDLEKLLPENHKALH